MWGLRDVKRWKEPNLQAEAAVFVLAFAQREAVTALMLSDFLAHTSSNVHSEMGALLATRAAAPGEAVFTWRGFSRWGSDVWKWNLPSVFLINEHLPQNPLWSRELAVNAGPLAPARAGPSLMNNLPIGGLCRWERR